MQMQTSRCGTHFTFSTFLYFYSYGGFQNFMSKSNLNCYILIIGVGEPNITFLTEI